MKNLEIQTTQNVAIQHRTASIGERMLATLIDLAIITSYYISVFLIMDNLPYNTSFSIGFIALIPIFFYHLVSEIFMNGQSFGKKALKIKVIKIDGSSPSVGSYFIRWIFRLIDINISYGSVAIISIAASKKSQRLGDMVAKTTVVSTKDTDQLQKTIYTELSNEYQAKYEAVKFLDDQDIKTVKEVLDHYYRNISRATAIDMLKRTEDAISKKAGITPTETPAEFLKTVLRDYTALHK
jgi:uncharacterized RDD family membrane protein YckC